MYRKLGKLIKMKSRLKSTHSTPRSDPSTALRTSTRGMLRVDTERRFLPRFKNRGLAPSNVSKRLAMGGLRFFWTPEAWQPLFQTPLQS
jgi:hypothetical protein